MFFAGVIAFLFFSLTDFNDLFFKKPLFKLSFPVGFVLLIISVAVQTLENPAKFSVFISIAFAIIAIAFLGLTIYSLFFTFPITSAYLSPGQKRQACTTGIYSLSRHPGVLWLTGFFFCLSISTGFPLYSAVTYSVLNILLAVLEDMFIFPNLLIGYEEYKQKVPFLIPRPRSIISCLNFYRKEDN